MIRHLFKLIWNKKKQNFLLILEMLISFMVMFAVFTLVVYYYKNYNKPMGFDYKNVWVINYSNGNPENSKSNDSINIFHESVKNMLKGMKEVEEVSFVSNNVPFSMNSSNNDVEYNKKRVLSNVYTAEDSYARTLNLKFVEGRWFSKADAATKSKPVVINYSLKQKLFGDEPAAGKLMGSENDRMRVIGVIEDMKDKGDFQEAGNSFFRRMDTSEMAWHNAILLKVSPNADASFESRLYKLLAKAIKNSTNEIEHLENKRENKNNMTLVPMIIMLVVASFLIINVALGLFGVLWYNINKRRGEIGLRRAVGAPGNSISGQLVGEALVLSTISLIIGSFFAVQFPLLNVFDLASSTYVVAIILSIIFIYVLVMICAFYPGKQAAAIYPAVALHEE